jgi:hypothetical protein
LIIRIEMTRKAPIAISPEAIALCAKKTKIAVIAARVTILRINANVPRKMLLTLFRLPQYSSKKFIKLVAWA